MIDWKQLLTAEDGYRRSRRSAAYGVKLPKAAKITDDLDELLALYDYPAEHWVHLRTTHPMVILSFCVSQICDLRRPVMDSVADGTLAA